MKDKNKKVEFIRNKELIISFINSKFKMTSFKKLFKESLAITMVSALLVPIGFAYVEPNITRGSGQFEISQSITAEITFKVAPSDVTLSPSLGGLTGGTSNGGTQFVVMTNNTAGWTVTLTASSTNGMEGESTAGVIPHLVETTPGVPDFDFDDTTVAVNTARFAYTVNASSTDYLATKFKDNGSACNTGSNQAALKCWISATSSIPFTILDSNTNTDFYGATSTIFFRVVVRENPDPLLPIDTYTATTTLTATMK